MSHDFRPGDRVMLCPVITSIDGDEANIVTWDGVHAKVWVKFLQPAEPTSDSVLSISAEPLSYIDLARLINHGRVQE